MSIENLEIHKKPRYNPTKNQHETTLIVLDSLTFEKKESIIILILKLSVQEGQYSRNCERTFRKNDNLNSRLRRKECYETI